MAFSFSNTASSGGDGGGGGGAFGGQSPSPGGMQIQEGPELAEIQTDQLGFAALNGEAQVRLLPTPWPSDALPPPTSSLLSVASSKGLVAAAGPDALFVTSTSGIRDAFRSPAPSAEEKIRPLDPQIKIPQPRLTHVAFSSDDSVLVVSSEREGGLLAYQVDSVTNGQTSPALQISTNGTGLRALAPNPVPESAELFAAVTNNGELVLADLKAGTLRSGSPGAVLQRGVSCISWSTRGKQLVAGHADGTATQIKPDGTVVAQIPKPTSLAVDVHVSGISWLENDSFFVIYTPNDTSEGIQPSEYYVVTRKSKTSHYTFQKLPEVLSPYGVERTPTFHFIARLRDFPPHIQDLLVLTATTSTDVSLISKTDKALSLEDNVTGVFTSTSIADDTRRAQLPLSPEMADTSPIGMALDLSSTEKVPNPIPSDPEILETAGPVPSLMILNNEGILVSWWLIYNDSVREKTLFSGFVSVAPNQQAERPGSKSPQPTPALSPSSAQPSPFAQPSFVQPSFGQPSFGQPSFGSAAPFRKPATSTFGAPTAPSGFGSFSGSAFGTPSAIGADQQSQHPSGFGASTGPSTNAPAFGQPAFGSATPLGGPSRPAFGSPSVLGSRTSVFGQPSEPSSSTAFGSGSTISPFASTGASTASGFASFSKTNAFSGFGGPKKDTSEESPFAKATGADAFSLPSSRNTFGAKETFAGVGAPTLDGGQHVFGTGGGFKLESSFKGDGTAKQDLPKPKEPSGFGFESAFGDMLDESKKAISPTYDQETEMMEEEGETEEEEEEGEKEEKEEKEERRFQQESKAPQTLVTPPSTLNQPKSTATPPLSSLFGSSGQQTTTPLPQSTTPAWSFDNLPSTTPQETPAPSHMALFGPNAQAAGTSAEVPKSEPVEAFPDIHKEPEQAIPAEPEVPKIKQEPASEEASVESNIPEAPLPPDTISKPRYVSGDTSVASSESKTVPEEAPLPPDFLPQTKSVDTEADQQGLPSDEEGAFSSEFEEESGEDVTGSISAVEEPTEEQNEQLQTSPESSFKSGDRSAETSPTGGLFTKVSTTTAAPKPARPLFGEVGTGPVFVPPKPQESPRSPSPVRHLVLADGRRMAPPRSVSAPAPVRSIIDKRKTEYQQSAIAVQAARAREEEAAKEKARLEALARSRAQISAEQTESLEDDEDERLRAELERPVSPSSTLEVFITYQPRTSDQSGKSGVPAQIERLYQDINSMIDTLGINARSLSAFLTYQQQQDPNQSWPDVLKSETPMDALNDEWVLDDTKRLHDGQAVLEAVLDESRVDDVAGKLERCHLLLGRDLFELRTKLTSIRKTLHARSNSDCALSTPLSAEQASIQHDLRKASAAVQTTLVQVEDNLAVLRAKLAEVAPAETSGKGSNLLWRQPASQKKPTVEAVANTIAKMTSMAEKKSADIDVLEAQLQKLDVSRGGPVVSGSRQGSLEPNGTPRPNRRSLRVGTPASLAASVYHTPDSKFGGSTRSTPGSRATKNGNHQILVSVEDGERWQAKARRKKEVAAILKDVLEGRRRQQHVSKG